MAPVIRRETSRAERTGADRRADPAAGRSGFGVGLRSRARTRSLLIGTLVGLLLWQGLAVLVAATTDRGALLVPSLPVILTDGLRGISHYYRGGLGARTTLQGAPDSYARAGLALAQNGLVSLARVGAGYLIAVAVGIPLGLLVAAARPIRLAVGGVAELLRMLPLLAMAPLFTLWFGADTGASVAFVAFGSTWVVLLATVHAVAHLPPGTVDYPRTLGLGPVRLRTRVILPAVLPELRGPLVLAAGVAWAGDIASELHGIQSGLGWALNQTLQYSLVDQMLVLTLTCAALSLVTLKATDALIARICRWTE